MRHPYLRAGARAGAAALTALAAVQLAAPVPAGAAGSTATYLTTVPMCRAAAAHHASCLGVRVIRSTHRTAGARVVTRHPSYAVGPAGGYTPGDLAAAYNVDPATATTRIVGIVDAYDDPRAKADLNTFDATYGYPAETATSFRKVSQTGSATAFPRADSGWAGEISLDVDAVRGMCHRCRIVLVEANSNSDADLAAAENQAVAQGATIVSNSFGGAEGTSIPSAFSSAFNHPGVVTLASTGDSGMYDWDQVNGGSAVSSNAPELPSSLNTVVAVGGTTLYLNDDGTRSGETVWNENGPSDVAGNNLFSPMGATGGGCSVNVNAQPWQVRVANYAQTACGARRLPADIAALADPYTGFDVYDSFGGEDWETVGGTSLATPLVAAMWALAGGSGGVRYGALSLYGHVQSDPSSLNDITTGGNGLCGGAPARLCARSFGTEPNTLGEGTLDCAWRADSDVLSVGTRACNAATGYDGPSGVGTPNGLNVFRPMSPTARISVPGTVTHGVPASFDASAATDPFPGGKITSYAWTWGDGTTSTLATAAAGHTYATSGTFPVTLTVTDNYGRTGTATTGVAVA